MLQYDEGRLNTKFKINDIAEINEDTKNKEFNILKEIFNDKLINNQKDIDKKLHGKRDRYPDIHTYFKSQVKLLKGVQQSKNPHAGYINACYINSPFSLDNNS